MKKKDLLTYGSIGCFVAALMLFYAIGDRAYGYYQLLRVVICLAGLFTAYVAYTYEAYVISVPSVFLAILFNPFAIITAEKETWQLIDLAAAAFFLAAGIAIAYELNKKPTDK